MSTNSETSWQAYEQRAYEVFCSTGHVCGKDEVIEGARGSHQIDVLVNLNLFPLGHRWLIECKNWSRRVGKREVHAFKTVIDDIGADHGYILSEHGFQKGAIEMANKFNISLCSLSELENQFQMEQLKPLHPQSRIYWASVKEEDDWGNMDSEAILELRTTVPRSVRDDIIEIHIFRGSNFKRLISKEKAMQKLTNEGTLRLCLPGDIPHLDWEAIPLEAGGVHLTGKTNDGMQISGPYTVVFRTLTGPVYVDAFVPLYK